ncbi:MAG TPA: hypothetical protein VMU95_40560 [Trebonia sp.]|nr:hypothetical protein [Trebonia sp.]
MSAVLREAACPPWCDANHGTGEGNPGLVLGGHYSRPASLGAGSHFTDQLLVRLYAPPGAAPAEVGITGFRPGAPRLFTDTEQAGQLARLVDQLAGATPAQHKALAAAIREAVITTTGPAR